MGVTYINYGFSTFIFVVLLPQKFSTYAICIVVLVILPTLKITLTWYYGISIFSPKTAFTLGPLTNFNFPETTIGSMGYSICQVAAGLRNIKPQLHLNRDLYIGKGHVTDFAYPISYRCSINSDTK